MHLVEFIVQGVRQFPDTLRIPLGTGYNALLAAPDGRTAVLFKTLHALFYQPALDGRRPDLCEPGAKVCRAGVTLVGRDGRSYRLLRDFLGGAVSLSVDSGGGAFSTLAATGQEVAQLLGAQVGMVSEDVYRALVSTALEDMPSRTAAAPMVGMPGQPGAPAGPTPQPGVAYPPGAYPPGAYPPGAYPPGAYPPGVAGYPGAVPPGMVPAGYPGAMAPGMGPPSHPGLMRPGMGPPSYPGAMQPGMGPPSYPGMGVNPYAQTMAPGMYWGGAPQSPFAHLSVDEKRAKLAELRGHQQAADALRNMEFELDGLQRRKFEIEDQLRPFRDAMRQLDEAKEKLQPFADLQDVPPDYQKKLDWFRKEQTKRDANLKTLLEEHRRERAALARSQAKPLATDPRFLGGVVGGVAAFALGFWLARSGSPGLWWIAMLDSVGFGLAGWVLLQRIADDELKSDTVRAERKLEERQSRVTNRFELDTTEVRKLLQRHNVDPDDLDPLEIRLNQRLEVLENIARIERGVHEVESQSGIDAIAINDELHRLEAQIAAAEDAVSKAGGVATDLAELTSQIHQLEAELGVAPQADAGSGRGYEPGYGGGGGGGSDDGSAPPTMLAPGDERVAWRCAGGPDDDSYGMGGGGGYNSGAASAPAQAAATVVMDHSRVLMEKADSLFCVGIAALAAQVAPRVAQFIGAFTEQRFASAQFGERGDLSLVEAASGRAVPFLLLAPPERDLAYLCLKFALLEAHVRLTPLPAVLHDPFVAVAELKHPLVLKLLQYLSSQMQIVHLTSLPALAPEGAGRIAL
jgi:hypothetical protein